MNKTLEIELLELREQIAKEIEQRAVKSRLIAEARGMRIAADIVRQIAEKPRTLINEEAIEEGRV